MDHIRANLTLYALTENYLYELIVQLIIKFKKKFAKMNSNQSDNCNYTILKQKNNVKSIFR